MTVRHLLLVAALLLPVAAPAGALASSAAVDPTTGVVKYAGGTEANDVFSTEPQPYPDTRVSISDGGAALTAGAGCTAGTPVLCGGPAGLPNFAEFRPGAGNDRVRALYGGSSGAIYGAAGDDRLQISAQRGSVYGGDGNDLVIARDNTPGDVQGNDGDDVLEGLENVGAMLGGNGNDFLIADGRLVSPSGGVGFDTLVGLPGSSGTFDGGDNNDLIAFAPGTFGVRVAGGAGADWIVGSDGVDSVNGGSGSDHVDTYGDGESDTVDCGSDFDWVYADAGDVVSHCEVVVRGSHAPSNPDVATAIAYAQAVAADPWNAPAPPA